MLNKRKQATLNPKTYYAIATPDNNKLWDAMNNKWVPVCNMDSVEILWYLNSEERLNAIINWNNEYRNNDSFKNSLKRFFKVDYKIIRVFVRSHVDMY